MFTSLQQVSRKSSVRFMFVCLLFLLLLCPAAPIHAGSVHYAAPSAEGSGDCSSWENACRLQTALTNSLSGDEIWVQAGVHKPTTVTYDRDATFTLKTGVGVYGGFAGMEAGRAERDWAANITVLSGDIDGNDIADPSGVVITTTAIIGANSYHVVTGSSVASNTVLDGFTITAGQSSYNGGGMVTSYSSLALANMTFSGNLAIHDGGGMANYNCSSLTLSNVTFTGNKAGFDGGGLYSNACQTMQVTNANFRDNAAVNDGGGMKNYASAPLITNIIFKNNAARYGGGLFNGFNELGSPTLINVIFSGNRARQGGGMYQYYFSSPKLTHVIFSGNQASNEGGGMYNWNNSSPILTNVTFAGNWAGTDGGAIYNGDASSPLLQNVIAWNNENALGGQAIFNNNSYGICEPSIHFSLVQGCNPGGSWNSACGVNGGNNLPDNDPLYVAPELASSAPNTAGDYRLKDTSPAIDIGENAADLDGPGPLTATISDIPEDLDGNPRIIQAVVDLGAYENQAFPCPAGGVVYVDDDAVGPYTGASWSEAFATLQDALYVREACEIWVAEGKYYPDKDSKVTEDKRSATFQLKTGVGVYGGFAGTETNREERDWEANITVLSGDIDGNDITTPTGIITTTTAITGANSIHVVTASDTSSSAVLDGFTITGGHADGSDDAGAGGGLVCKFGSPLLTHITFIGNSAANEGGGMYATNTGFPALVDVVFDSNAAAYGGGFFTSYCMPDLEHVLFTHNLAGSIGGGMYNGGYTDTELNHVIFDHNSAGASGGGMYNRGEPSLTDVTFTGNQAGSGGGMYADGPAVLINVRFKGNSAAYGGGMISALSSSPALTNVTFSGNAANGTYGDGGFGGGLWNSGSSPTLTNVAFSGNSATYSGGGMYNQDSSSPTVTNSILWGNSPDQALADAGSYPIIGYSDVQGGCPAGSVCTNVLNADPLFVDAAGGDLRLHPGSPAIDAGNNYSVTVITDLAGGPRFVDIPAAPDTGLGIPPLVDMGAYEANFVDAALLKAASSPAVLPGESITFTLTFSNGGSITATHVVVSDSVPAFLGSPSFISGGAIVSDTGHLPPYVWTVQDLAPGQGGTITVTGVLTIPLAAGTYTNTAAIAVDEDAAVENNTASLAFSVLNAAPAFTSVPLTAAVQGTLYTYMVSAGDANGDALTITAPARPDWLTLTDHGNGTATLSGTPANADVGGNAVVLHVADSGGLANNQSFTVAVANANDAPFFTSAPVTTATQGILYTYTITAADPDLQWGDVLTITATTRPAWLTLTDHGDGTATLSGTPANADVGGSAVELRVADSGKLTNSQSFSLTVANANDAPFFTSAPVTTATQGILYTYTMTAVDPDLQWGDALTITAPARPDWLTLTDHGDGTATLSGTPANADVGSNTVELRVTDSGGLANNQSFTVAVANANDAPFFTSAPVTTATQGILYTYTTTAADPDLQWGDALTITATTRPAWLTLTDHGDGTATLSGTPAKTDAGDHLVVVHVADSGGLTDTQTFTITVWRRVYLPLVLSNAP